MESIHEKLERVRKPRVHIKYEVETEGAVVLKELPFVVGVMGDFSGDQKAAQKPLKDRKFIQIDRDNFNEVMAKIQPSLNLKVDNTLKGDGSQIGVALEFKHIDDFEPAKVVQQVEPLRKMLDTRNKLRDLLTKIDCSENLENILEKVLQNSEEFSKFSQELGLEANAASAALSAPAKKEEE